jgi:hypothetical protein
MRQNEHENALRNRHSQTREAPMLQQERPPMRTEAPRSDPFANHGRAEEREPARDARPDHGRRPDKDNRSDKDEGREPGKHH